MHVKSLVLGAAVAFQASTAVAEAPRARIYFPRHVKRQFTNTNTTSPDSFPPAETTPFETRSESPNFVTSIRNSVTDFLTSNSESSEPTSSDGRTSSNRDGTTIIVSTTRESSPAPTSPVTSSFFAPELSSSRFSTTAESADETTQESSSDETTVAERNSSTGGLPTAILQPTETEEEPIPTTSRSAPAATTSAVPDEETTSNTPVIIIGPTGVVSSSSSIPTTSPSSTRSSSAAQIETSTDESVPTTSAVADETTTSSVRVPTTSDVAPTTESSTTPEAAATTSSAANTTSEAADVTTSSAANTTSEAANVTTSEAANVTTSEAANVTTSEADAVTTSSPAAANTTSEVADVTTTSAAADPARSSEALTTDAATTTSRLLDPIVSIISEIVPSVPANDTETTTTQLADPTTTLVEATTTSDGADVTSLPDITSLPTIIEPSITPNSTDSELPPSETSTPPVDSSVVTSLPPTETSISSFPPEESEVPGNSTTTDLPPVSASETSLPTVSETSLPSVLPSESGSLGNETSFASEPTATPTDLPVSSGLPSDISDVSDLISSTVPAAIPTSTADIPTTVQSILTTEEPATSTPPPNTWLPDTIIAEQSTPSVVPTFPGASGSTVIAMPSDLPQAIGPDKPDEGQPEGTRLLQVGFLYAENYQFVTEEPMAAAQIFTYLPEALAHGAQIDMSKVKVVRLVPFDTRASLGYITTLARFYYPESMVDKLRMDIKYPNSLLYNHQDELVYNLTSNINSAIDIIPGNEIEPNAPGSDGGSPDSNPGNTNILGNSESSSTPIQKGTAAAIGIGAVSVAAAYGAAMFLVARRYKQKKQAHRRSSSIANSSEMRYAGNGSPAMMGGALLSRDFTGYGYGGMAGGRNSHGSGRSGAGNSVRTAQISAPVAAENSLGWN